MSTQEVGKYRQFFDVDEKYFPCIDDSAIEAGAPWENTYPHETFIELLKNVENMLGGSTKRSVWIHGAYGTGKSQCAHALKKILEVPEEELKAYWNQYEPLKNNADLLNKIIGHKERGIVTAYRYASGGITTPRDLYFAIQESVKKALESSPCVSYMGENTLTDNTTVEKQEIIALLSQFGRPDNLSDIYPDLCMYLEKYCFHGDTLSKELTEYFEDYKQQKIRNSIDDSFMKKVERYAVSREYNRLRTRDELISAVDRESTFLCWIDALGVEYLAYIVEAAKCRGLMVSVKVGRSKLPTITSVNNQFFYDWPEEHREKIEELDDVKHKEKGGYKYGPNNRYPIHLAKELEIIADAIDRAATELALRHYDKYVITSDHGASRLAVISGIEEKYETDTKGEHSGRCCKTFNNYDLPFATEESGFIVLADYGRFKGSRAANVEVHGGATLEEVVVPVIELSLSDNSIKIELADANVVSDYRNGADLCIFVNKSLTQKLCVHVDGEASQAVRTDENHYKVHVTNMKRAKTYAVDVYVGENLVTRLDVTTKGKSASVNSEFDDLF